MVVGFFDIFLKMEFVGMLCLHGRCRHDLRDLFSWDSGWNFSLLFCEIQEFSGFSSGMLSCLCFASFLTLDITKRYVKLMLQ